MSIFFLASCCFDISDGGEDERPNKRLRNFLFSLSLRGILSSTQSFTTSVAACEFFLQHSYARYIFMTSVAFVRMLCRRNIWITLFTSSVLALWKYLKHICFDLVASRLRTSSWRSIISSENFWSEYQKLTCGSGRERNL